MFPFGLPSEHPIEGVWQVEGCLASWKNHWAEGARVWVGARQPHRILGILLPLSDQPAGSCQRVCPSSHWTGSFNSPGQKALYPAPKETSSRAAKVGSRRQITSLGPGARPCFAHPTLDNNSHPYIWLAPVSGTGVALGPP